MTVPNESMTVKIVSYFLRNGKQLILKYQHYSWADIKASVPQGSIQTSNSKRRINTILKTKFSRAYFLNFI